MGNTQVFVFKVKMYHVFFILVIIRVKQRINTTYLQWFWFSYEERLDCFVISIRFLHCHVIYTLTLGSLTIPR